MEYGSSARSATRVLTWPLAPALVAGMLVVEQGKPGLSFATSDGSDIASNAPFAVAILVCWVVGVVLTGRAFQQVAGWAFLGLGTALAWSGFTDLYARTALRSPSSELSHGTLFATLGDTSFVWWFLFLGLILQFTPSVRPTTGLWRLLPGATLFTALTFQLGALLRSTHLSAPNAEVTSPLAVDSLAKMTATLSSVALLSLMACLLISVTSLVLSFRRSRDEDRKQLLWLVAGALPMAMCLVGSFAASYAGSDAAAGLIMSLGISTLALGAGLSVAKYRLYDVERVVSKSASYAMASGAVVVVFGLVILVISRSIPTPSSTAWWPVSVATLAATGVARPAYVWARNAVDRRFNRRRFDAVKLVRAGLRQPHLDVEALLRESLGDPTARVIFPDEGGGWVTSAGHDAGPLGHTVDVVRDEHVGGRLEYDPRRTEHTIAAAASGEAATEIDNLGLRAELARQVEQISESRARLAGAHLEERQRIERDLHDGAQQRILAIALQLRSALVNGAEDVLRDEVDRAITHLGLTVQELRDLAGGLQPAALAGGGLRAAVEDLSSRSPVRLELAVVDARFPPAIESAAWFVIAEALSNVVKHAHVGCATVTVTHDTRRMVVAVTDAGVGGAQPQGRGLQGLADRVAALGGALTVHDQTPSGTRVKAWLPCG
ncbi:MAG: hypothetical protein QOD98_2790 [Nocardioidaceae bacterium]|jgi:signal transduction histidine kinase|nr:hypothetical protein [Nocardioidaceae bacterium]